MGQRGAVRCVAIQDFRDVAQPSVSEMIFHGSEPFRGLAASSVSAAIDLHIRADKRAEQPRPDSSLMVPAIAAGGITRVASPILRIAGYQPAQPVRSQEVLVNPLHDASSSLRRQHAVLEAHGEDLIRADRGIGGPPLTTSYRQLNFSFQNSRLNAQLVTVAMLR